MKQEDIKCFRIELPEDILKAKWCGDFARAERLIRVRLEDERTPEFLKHRLICEQEVLARLPGQYTLSQEEGLALVRKSIPDFSEKELSDLMDTGAVDWIYINGTPHLATRFFETLQDVYPDISKRAGKAADFTKTPGSILLDQMIARIKKDGSMKRHIHMKTTFTIHEDAFKKGKVLVHLPIPKPQVNMSKITILSVSPETGVIGSEDQAQRTVSFTEEMTQNHPFSVEYEYDSFVEYHDTEAMIKQHQEGKAPKKTTFDGSEKAYAEADLAEEAPHIRFTDTIKALANELMRDPQNNKELSDPLLIARSFYDFVTTKVVYSYMREYFDIEEITEYAALGLKGDCGVQALLFITLCRFAGIPARWQSGMYVTPKCESKPAEAGSHDWAMFYVEPYGWLFADPSFGGSAYRSGAIERWNYYFGNLDVNRMAANDRFQAGLIPEKQFTRNDPYDNQTGEAEWQDRGLTYQDRDSVTEVIEHRSVQTISK